MELSDLTGGQMKTSELKAAIKVIMTSFRIDCANNGDKVDVDSYAERIM